jgi:hypothetical protein
MDACAGLIARESAGRKECEPAGKICFRTLNPEGVGAAYFAALLVPVCPSVVVFFAAVDAFALVGFMRAALAACKDFFPWP